MKPIGPTPLGIALAACVSVSADRCIYVILGAKLRPGARDVPSELRLPTHSTPQLSPHEGKVAVIPPSLRHSTEHSLFPLLGRQIGRTRRGLFLSGLLPHARRPPAAPLVPPRSPTTPR